MADGSPKQSDIAYIINCTLFEHPTEIFIKSDFFMRCSRSRSCLEAREHRQHSGEAEPRCSPRVIPVRLNSGGNQETTTNARSPLHVISPDVARQQLVSCRKRTSRFGYTDDFGATPEFPGVN